MVDLLGNNGKVVTFPDEQKDAVLATGQFSEVPAAQQNGIPPVPDDEKLRAAEASLQPKPKDESEPVLNLINKETNQTEQIPESQATQKIREGTHSVTDVPLTTYDGKVVTFPDEQIPKILQEHPEMFRLSTLKEREDARVKAERAEKVEREGITQLKPYIGGGLDSAIGGAIEHAPFFDTLQTITKKIDPNFAPTGQSFEDLENATENAKKENPASYGLGTLGGVAASLYAGAKVGSAVTGAAGLTGVAKAATEGVIYSADPIIKDTINGDYGHAAAEALAGGLTNIGLHQVFSAVENFPSMRDLGRATRSVIGETATSGVTQEEAENLIGKQVLGLTPAKISQVRDQIAPALKAAGITAEDITSGKAMDKIQALEDSGAAIGKAIKQLDQLPETGTIIKNALDTAQEDVRKLLPQEVIAREAAEANLKKTKIFLEEAETAAEKTQAKESVALAKQNLKDIGELSPSALQAQKALTPILDEMASVANKGTFAETQELKKFIRGQTNFTDNGFQNQLRKTAYNVVTENLMKAEDQAARELGLSPEMAEGLRQQRAAYTFHKIFGDAADRLAAKNIPESTLQQLAGLNRHNHGLAAVMMHMLGVPAPIAAGAGLSLPFVRNYLAKQTLGRAAKKLLQESSQPSTDMVLHAVQQQDVKIKDGVKQLLGALSSSSVSKAIHFDHSPLKPFLLESGAGKTDELQLKSIRTAVDQNISNPEQFANHLGNITAPLRAEGLNQVADAYTDHQLRLMKVMDSIIPKDPSMSQAHPFSSNVEPDEISPATKTRYEKALTIAADPINLLQMIKSNTITQGDVAIAAATNPATLQIMRNALVDEALKSKPNLSYQQRLSIGVFMGTNIDESTEQVPVLQSVYGPLPPSGTSGTPGKGSKSKGSASQEKSFSSSYLTGSQKAAGH